MANIRIIVNGPLVDGHKITFKAPCNCTEIEKLDVRYIKNESQTSKLFSLKDTHGNDLTGIGNLFMKDAYVSVVLDTNKSVAYVQNADTNSYIEGKFEEVYDAMDGRLSLEDGGRIKGDVMFYGNVNLVHGGRIWFQEEDEDSWSEVLRMGGDTSTPILIVGDGLFTKQMGYTNVCGGTGVYMRISNDSTRGVSCAYDGSNTYFRPLSDVSVYLGSGGKRWADVYGSKGTISTSDEREKNSITAIVDYPSMFTGGNALEMLFSRLVPKTYYLNMESDKPELHIGFIAQDIAAVLEDLGMSEDDLGLLNHEYWIDEETGEEKDAYGLRYEEFIALNTYMIQKLYKERESFEERLAKLERRFEE